MMRFIAVFGAASLALLCGMMLHTVLPAIPAIIGYWRLLERAA